MFNESSALSKSVYFQQECQGVNILMELTKRYERKCLNNLWCIEKEWMNEDRWVIRKQTLSLLWINVIWSLNW